MGAEVDRLEIAVEAESKNANTQLDSLISKLESVSSALSGVSTKGFSNFASGISTLSDSMQKVRSVKMTDFNRIVRGLDKFNSVDPQKLNTISNSMEPLASSINTLGSVQYDNKNLTSLINGMSRLGNANIGDTEKIREFGNALTSVCSSLATVPDMSKTTSPLVNGIARLANAGAKTGASASALPIMSANLRELLSTLSLAPAVSEGTVSLTTAIAKLASAGTRTADTAKNLHELSVKLREFIQSLTTAPQVSQNTVQLVSAIGNIASAGKSANGAFNSISNSGGRTTSVIRTLASGFRRLKSHISSTHNSSKGLASAFGMFYAKCFMIIRAVKAFGNAIGSAQDYIEEFNYFTVALNKVGQDSASQFKQAGYDSAESYAASFKSRFGTLQKQMTGFKVDYDTGDATFDMSHNLGLDITEVMKYNAAISQITNSAGMLGETSIMTSKALSMLSADWSSLSNQDLSDVMNNMQSGLIGQSRALYKYGIDTTKAGLSQTALAHGIKVNVTNLSQQAKMQLRVLTMLEQSKVAYGDLARTINQPANQLRMLQAGWKNLCRTIGSIFIPVVQSVYPYLNALIMVIQEFAQWVAKVAGVKLGDVGGGISLPDYEDASDGVDDYADSTDKAAKKQKKLNDNLQGFDLINKLSGNDSGSDDGTSGTSGKPSDLDLSSDIADALKGYESIWDKAFKSNKNKAVELAKKIKKALVDGWNKGGDYTSVGVSFGKWINKGLRKIPWSNIQSTTNKVAKSIATFLNGAVKGLDWALLGKTLAEALNTAVGAVYTFLTTFDWLKFGKSIGTGINSAIKNFDWSLLGKTIGAKLRAQIQVAFGLITTFDFKTAGKKIGDAINGFLNEMGKVDKRTGLNGWQELGKSISDGIKGIADTLITAMNTVNWSSVGKSIGDFLGQLDWIGILGKLGTVVVTALWSVIKTAVSAFVSDPVGVSSTIATVLGGYFAYKKLAGVASVLKGSVGIIFLEGIKSSKIAVAAVNLASTFKTTLVKAMASSKIGLVIARAISAITAAGAGIKAAISGVATKISTALATAFSSATFVTTLTSAFGAAIAAAIAGAAIADRINEAIDATNFTGDYELKVPEKMKENAKKVQDSFKETAAKAKDTKEEIDGMNKSIESISGKNINDLADKYFKLSQKTNPTASDIAVMKTYSDELSKSIPGLSDNIDKQTGAFKGTKTQLDGLVDSYVKAAKAQAAYNTAVELYEKKDSNKSRIDEKKEELKKYEKEFKVAQENLKNLGSKEGKDSTRYKTQLKVVGTYADKVNGCRAEINKLNESNKQINNQIKRNNNVMETAKVKTDDYKKATSNLKDSMSKLGVSGKDQKTILGNLKEKLDNGEISWKNYKKITDGSYASISQMNNEIEKLAPKTVEVSATTSGKEKVDKLNKSISTFNTLPDQKFIELSLKNRNISEKIQGIINGIKVAPIPIKLTTPSGKALDAVAKATSIAMKNAFGKSAGMPVGMKAPDINVNKKTAMVDKNDFVTSNMLKMSGYKVSFWKDGGFPTTGQMFIAREAGPELVGNIGGKNAVANNDQITTAITNAVAPAVYAAVKAAVNEELQNGNIGGGDVYLDGEKVTKSVMSNAQRISKGRGNSPAWSM